MPKQKKELIEEGTVPTDNVKSVSEPTVASLAAKIDAQQKELEMLRAVADKGRVYNYESKGAEKKAQTVKLAVHDGRILVGWRTIKDVLVKNPTTGRVVGEEQEYELLLLDKEDKIEKMKINSYPRFTEIMFTDQLNARVIGRKEDEQGNFTFTLALPDGREIDLDQRFINS